MKKGSKILSALLACLLAAGLAGCAEGEPQPSGEVTEAKVWSTYGTAKVTQNAKESVPYAVQDAAVGIQMMKDETEGTQLVVTAGSEDIAAYDLSVSALSDGKGNAIPAEQIAVYHQKYLEVTRKSDILNTEYLAGDRIPDMLLPLAIAKEYGENTIAAGENQGITVEVTTTKSTVPGTYTGVFVLDLDGQKQEIPVTVEVWDILYEGRRSFQSSFLLYRNTLVSGEYEASDELVERYTDFLLDYNVNTYVIKDAYTVEEEVAELVRLFENENYNSFCIPRIMEPGYTATGGQANDIIDYIVAVAEISTPEKPYVESLYIYPTYFDEADMYAQKYEDVVNAFKEGGEWDKTLERALAAVKATDAYKNADEAFRAQLEHAVANIPAILTNTTFRGDWVASSHVTFCPYLNLFGDDAMLQQYQDAAAENNDGDLWAYTCVGPNYPNPTFHIDDYNLGTRITGWMAKKFGVNGYLYWSVNMYQAINADTWRDVDVYETAERASYCAGDGFLVYPGAYYGSEYPFASIRLAAWRDAMDDYDMLTVYEQLVEERAKEYGVTVDFSSLVNDLYDSLFAGTYYYTDDALVVAARAALAERILALQGEDGIIAVPERGGVTVYASASSLEIDGETVQGAPSGSGYKYTVANTGTAAKDVTVASGTARYTIRADAAGLVASFAGGTGDAVVTEGSSVSYAEGRADVTIAAQYRSDDETIDGATRRFTPYVQFGADGLTGAAAVRFTMQNTGEADITFTFYIVTKDGTALQAGTGYVKAGGARSFRIAIEKNAFSAEVLAGVSGVRLAFRNVNEAGTALEPVKNFSLGDIWFEIDS